MKAHGGRFQRRHLKGGVGGWVLWSLCEQFKLPHTTQQVGAMFSLFFVEAPVHNFADVCKTDHAFFNQFFWGMLNRGIYLAPSPFEASFTSICHQPAEIDATLNAMEATLQSMV